MRIALLEDDIDQANLVEKWLIEAGHSCYVSGEGKEYIRHLSRESYDLLILDWMVYDLSGEEVLYRVKNNMSPSPPIMFVTARKSETEIAKILQAGADDYMVKPIKKLELLARVQALGRRGPLNTSAILEIGPYTINSTDRTIGFDGKIVKLSDTEFKLGKFMLCNLGRLVSRGHILENVWGLKPDIDTRTVDTHLSRLRQKLKLTPKYGWKLSAVYQHGYRLEQISADSSQSAGQIK